MSPRPVFGHLFLSLKFLACRVLDTRVHFVVTFVSELNTTFFFFHLSRSR